MISNFTSVINAYSKAFSYLGKRSYGKFMLIPIAVNILMLVAMVVLALQYSSALVEVLMKKFEVAEESYWSWLSPIVGIAASILVLMAYFLVYKYLILTIISPFLAVLSERVDADLTKEEYPFSWYQLLKDFLRAVSINFRNFVFEILATIIFGLCAFIPVVGLVSPLVLLIVQSYFFGFALMDFNAERRRLNRRETEAWMRSHFWLVSGVGALFYFIFLIPLIGWILAPIWASIAGTLVWLKEEQKIT